MDRILLDALNGYTRMMKEGFHVSSSEKKRLIAATFAYKMLTGGYASYMDDDRLKDFKELVRCIMEGSCLFSVVFEVTRESIASVNEEGIITFTEIPVYTESGKRMVSYTGETVTFGDFNFVTDVDNGELFVGYNPSTKEEVRIQYGLEDMF